MANERSETRALFMKLVTPAEIYDAVRNEGSPYDHDLINLHSLLQPTHGRLSLWAANPDTERDENAWLYRESARMNVLWSRLPNFDHAQLASACELDNPSTFWRWCLAPSFDTLGKVRYTPSAEYGKADRQIVTTLGKFLTKHYPGIGASAIRDWQNEWSGMTGDVKVLFAETPDEVEHVYMNGPQSCMTDRSFDEQPSRLWGHCKDTAVAYIRENGGITARTLVRKDTKKWIRIYPGTTPRFEQGLRNLGYEHDSYGLSGLAVPVIRGGRTSDILMPYCDGISTGRFDEGTNTIVLGEGHIDVQTTHGYTTMRKMWQCPNCSCEHRSEDAERYSDYEEMSYCDNCSHDFLEAQTDKRRWQVVLRNNATQLPDGSFVLTNMLEELGWVALDNGDFIRQDDAACLDTGTWVHQSEAALCECGAVVLVEEAKRTPWKTWVVAANAVSDDDGNWAQKEDLWLEDELDGTVRAVAFQEGLTTPQILKLDAEVVAAFRSGRLNNPDEWLAKYAGFTQEQLLERGFSEIAQDLLIQAIRRRTAEAEAHGQYVLAA